MIHHKIWDRGNLLYYFLSIEFSLTFLLLHWNGTCAFEIFFQKMFSSCASWNFYFFKITNIIMQPAFIKLVSILYFWFLSICLDFFSFRFHRAFSIKTTWYKMSKSFYFSQPVLCSLARSQSIVDVTSMKYFFNSRHDHVLFFISIHYFLNNHCYQHALNMW